MTEGRTSRFQKPRARRGSTVDVRKLLLSLGIEVARAENRSLFALCPGHDDTSPDTWSIVDDPRNPLKNGSHYCFSCQFGGGPVALVRQVRSCSHEEALEYLEELPAHEGPLDLQVEVGNYQPHGTREFELPRECRMDVPFHEWPAPARTYLTERQVTIEQIEAFRIGYAVSGRLEGRIVFPMLERKSGAVQVRSYTARDFTGQQRKRYKEPQTSEGADKEAIFGAHLMSSDSFATVVIAEGPFDTLALDSVALPKTDVCALHGSHLYPSQAVRFSRYPLVVIATNNDGAGNRVAEEIRGALERYTEVRRLLTPEGKDCSDLLRDNKQQLAELLERAFD